MLYVSPTATTTAQKTRLTLAVPLQPQLINAFVVISLLLWSIKRLFSLAHQLRYFALRVSYLRRAVSQLEALTMYFSAFPGLSRRLPYNMSSTPPSTALATFSLDPAITYPETIFDPSTCLRKGFCAVAKSKERAPAPHNLYYGACQVR